MKKFLSAALANYTFVIINGVLSFLLVPVYLTAMGKSGWGGVGLFLVVQSLMLVFESGLTQLMIRDLRRLYVQGWGISELYQHYRVRFRIFSVGSLIVAPFATIIYCDRSIYSLNDSIAIGVLVGISVFLQFSSMPLYAMLGACDEQVRSGVCQTIGALLRHAFCLIIVFFISRTPFAYCVGILMASVLEFTIVQHQNNRFLKKHATLKENASKEVASWTEVGYLGVAVIIGGFASQIDKLILARSISPGVFAGYMLIFSVAGILLQLQYPLSRTIFPMLVGESSVSKGLLARILPLVVLFSALPSLFVYVLARWFLTLWVGRQNVTDDMVAGLHILALGVLVNCCYNYLYLNLIRHSKARSVLLCTSSGLACGLFMGFLPVQKNAAWGGYIFLAVNGGQLIACVLLQLIAAKKAQTN